ncbi:MAG: GNAT family N-acetyltransferase [Candidatus Acidiferrales bacterium]
MSIVVRAADLQNDRSPLIAFLFQHLSARADTRRFDWLYLRNPHGPARAWLASDGSTSALIGASAVFPRQMRFCGKEISACVLGDFCIHPDYRSLGPALQLQRATIAGMQAAGIEFGYDLPSASMLGVYQRLGIAPRESLVRMARPLRADQQIGQRVKNETVARGLSAAGNLVLQLRDWRLKESEGWTIALHDGLAGEEFLELGNAAEKSGGLCVYRSAAYLNWRYREHPSRKFELLTARHHGKLKGFLVLEQVGADVTIVDLFGVDERELWQSLLARAVTLSRERGMATLSAPVIASHPRAAQLEALGFFPRETHPIVTIGDAENGQLFLMDGDRES